MLSAFFSRASMAGVWSALLCGSSLLPAQSPPVKPTDTAVSTPYVPHLTFDVVSIHESHERTSTYINNAPNNSFYEAHVAPVSLIMGAYQLHRFDLLQNVPSWAMNTEFDITAKSDAATDEALSKLSKTDDEAEKAHMLQELLADRFKLRIHHETKIAKTYELVTTPRTAQLMIPSHADPGRGWGTCQHHFSSRGIEIDSKGCPFSILLSNLQQGLETDILDHTGLSGGYEYHLMWNPRPPLPDNATDPNDRFPSLLDAVRQQLGLELKETRGPVTRWVVDHIERPTSN